MAEPEDDEAAYHWAGDEFGGREGPRLPKKGGADAEPADHEMAVADLAVSISPARTALNALFAVLFLALTVGWIFAVQLTSAPSSDLATQVLWQFGEFTAIVAAPLWFGTALLLTRESATRWRAGWLALGLGVLLPWPLLPLVLR